MILMHFVLDVFVHFRELAFEVEMDVEIEISLVPIIGSGGKCSVQFLSFLHGQVVVEVEDRLLPVSVRTFWAGGKSNSLVAVSELDVKETHQGVDVVVASHPM